MQEDKSKSQKKRDAHALQEFGTELVKLTNNELATLPIPDELLDAIKIAKSTKSHGAKKRQLQFIGKLLRNIDSDELLNAYERLKNEDDLKSAKFHEIEQWRERLLNQEDNALTEFIHKYQPENIQLLRQLIKKASLEKKNNSKPHAYRELFRFIRQCQL